MSRQVVISNLQTIDEALIPVFRAQPGMPVEWIYVACDTKYIQKLHAASPALIVQVQTQQVFDSDIHVVSLALTKTQMSFDERRQGMIDGLERAKLEIRESSDNGWCRLFSRTKCNCSLCRIDDLLHSLEQKNDQPQDVSPDAAFAGHEIEPDGPGCPSLLVGGEEVVGPGDEIPASEVREP